MPSNDDEKLEDLVAEGQGRRAEMSEWIKQVNKTTFSLFSKILTFINNKCNHRAERLTTAWILS